MTPRFQLGREYSRKRDIHARFGGQQQGGIITPRGVPAVFLVTGETGKRHGYEDGWQDDGAFEYFGEGQFGDMDFVRGNRALRDHAVDGKELHLFEDVGGGTLTYKGQFLCDGYEIVRAPDSSGKPRNAISFRLIDYELDPKARSKAEKEMAGKSLSELRKIAKSAGARSRKRSKGSNSSYYERSAAVKAYVRARANGTCEACEEPAPFIDKRGEPYLEPHHTQRLADDGPDDPANVIAVCPTCHRRVHSGRDGTKFNAALKRKLSKIEPA